MLREELFFICLYVASFGFSDWIVDTYKFRGGKLLFYYFVIMTIGLIGVFFCKKCTF